MFEFRRLLKVYAASLSLLGIAACDNSDKDSQMEEITGTPTAAQLIELEANTTLASGFGIPTSDGTFSASLTTILKGNFQDDAGNGYAFELGRDGTAFSAFVGLLPSTDLEGLPKTGLASMRGTYQVVEVGKSDGDLRDFGEPASTNGRITLRADFDFGTLSGSDGILTIDGTFSDKTLAGNAFFNERAADLGGQIGDDRAVGVFHGTDDASTYIGGFLVER